MRNFLRNDSAEQVDQINDPDKQVNTLSDCKKLVDAESDPSSNPKVSTQNTNGNFTQKLFISPFVPKNIPIFIGTINLLVVADVVGVQGILSPRQTVLPKSIVTDAARSYARIFWVTPGKVVQTNRNDSMPQDFSYNENSRLGSPIPVSNPNSISPARFGNQEVISPIHPNIAKRGRNSEPFDALIDGSLAVNGQSTS